MSEHLRVDRAVVVVSVLGSSSARLAAGLQRWSSTGRYVLGRTRARRLRARQLWALPHLAPSCGGKAPCRIAGCCTRAHLVVEPPVIWLVLVGLLAAAWPVGGSDRRGCVTPTCATSRSDWASLGARLARALAPDSSPALAAAAVQPAPRAAVGSSAPRARTCYPASCSDHYLAMLAHVPRHVVAARIVPGPWLCPCSSWLPAVLCRSLVVRGRPSAILADRGALMRVSCPPAWQLARPSLNAGVHARLVAVRRDVAGTRRCTRPVALAP